MLIMIVSPSSLFPQWVPASLGMIAAAVCFCGVIITNGTGQNPQPAAVMMQLNAMSNPGFLKQVACSSWQIFSLVDAHTCASHIIASTCNQVFCTPTFRTHEMRVAHPLSSTPSIGA